MSCSRRDSRIVARVQADARTIASTRARAGRRGPHPAASGRCSCGRTRQRRRQGVGERARVGEALALSRAAVRRDVRGADRERAHAGEAVEAGRHRAVAAARGRERVSGRDEVEMSDARRCLSRPAPVVPIWQARCQFAVLADERSSVAAIAGREPGVTRRRPGCRTSSSGGRARSDCAGRAARRPRWRVRTRPRGPRGSRRVQVARRRRPAPPRRWPGASRRPRTDAARPGPRASGR